MNNADEVMVESGFDITAPAYDNIHEPVFNVWLRQGAEERRQSLLNKYVLYSCAYCTGSHLRKLLQQDDAKALGFVTEWVLTIRWMVSKGFTSSEEWFKSLDLLSSEFTALNFVSEARTLVAIGIKTGVRKYPRLALSLQLRAAFLDAITGRRSHSSEYALDILRHPYKIPSRRQLPELCYQLMYILAAANRIYEYRLVLWTGVNLPFLPSLLRDSFVNQIVKTYRGTLRAVMHPDVPLKYRILLPLARLSQLIGGIPLLRLIKANAVIEFLHNILLYLHGRLFYKTYEIFRLSLAPGTDNKRHKSLDLLDFILGLPKVFSRIIKRTSSDILITRAMGGLGDIMMMTPGLLALKKKNPRATINFAIPKGFHPLVAGLPGINVIDIDDPSINLSKYRKWKNLTECPAGRVESRQYPNVRSNRIVIFAKSMGVSYLRLKMTQGFKPYYKVTDEEYSNALLFCQQLGINRNERQLVGVQPYSVDSYKNWPYMFDLIYRLSQRYYVLVFHNEPLPDMALEYVYVINKPIRQAVALLSLCNKLVAVDSSFLHIGAAIDIDTIGIFGPTSGKVFTRYYPKTTYITPVKRDYPCYPCWRNEHKPCHLTNGRESICLRSISVDLVMNKIESTSPTPRPTAIQSLVTWLRYGRE